MELLDVVAFNRQIDEYIAVLETIGLDRRNELVDRRHRVDAPNCAGASG